MQPRSSNETRISDDVRNEEQLITPASHGRESGKEDESKDRPGCYPSLGQGIRPDFGRNVVEAPPAAEPEAHVDGSGQPERPGGPSVQPVEPFVARARQEADDVPLAGQQQDERQLGDGHEARPVADCLPRPLVQGVEPVEAEHHDGDEVGQDNADSAQRRRLELPPPHLQRAEGC